MVEGYIDILLEKTAGAKLPAKTKNSFQVLGNPIAILDVPALRKRSVSEERSVFSGGVHPDFEMYGGRHADLTNCTKVEIRPILRNAYAPEFFRGDLREMMLTESQITYLCHAHRPYFAGEGSTLLVTKLGRVIRAAEVQNTHKGMAIDLCDPRAYSKLWAGDAGHFVAIPAGVYQSQQSQ
jgi:hypothetical protein